MKYRRKKQNIERIKINKTKYPNTNSGRGKIPKAIHQKTSNTSDQKGKISKAIYKRKKKRKEKKSKNKISM